MWYIAHYPRHRGLPRSCAVLKQIPILRMAADIGGDEGTARHDLASFLPDLVEHAAHQLRADALAFDGARHLGVRDGDRAVIAAIIGDGEAGRGLQFEAVAGRIVADGVGHGGTRYAFALSGFDIHAMIGMAGSTHPRPATM